MACCQHCPFHHYLAPLGNVLAFIFAIGGWNNTSIHACRACFIVSFLFIVFFFIFEQGCGFRLLFNSEGPGGSVPRRKPVRGFRCRTEIIGNALRHSDKEGVPPPLWVGGSHARWVGVCLKERGWWGGGWQSRMQGLRSELHNLHLL